MKNPKPVILNTLDVWEHLRNVENTCVLKCLLCFTTIWRLERIKHAIIRWMCDMRMLAQRVCALGFHLHALSPLLDAGDFVGMGIHRGVGSSWINKITSLKVVEQNHRKTMKNLVFQMTSGLPSYSLKMPSIAIKKNYVMATPLKGLFSVMSKIPNSPS